MCSLSISPAANPASGIALSELDLFSSQLYYQRGEVIRIGVLELVWMTVLADDRVDTLESQLMRRLAGLLFVSDVDSGLAAKAAKKRLDVSPAT